ncbi:MAG: transcriptional regulator [Friedmanniella sp.]|nr:transcriptional regulator [Friedmanniella sp.]
MTAVLRIDDASPTPPYEQLTAQLTAQIRRGTRAAGSRLPTVRALAAELGLAPNTVAKVYRELEQEGLVVTAGRRGTVVADPHVEATAEAEQATRDYVERVTALGLGPAEATRLLRQVLYGGSAPER